MVDDRRLDYIETCGENLLFQRCPSTAIPEQPGLKNMPGMPQPPAKDPFAFDRAKIGPGQKASMSPVLQILPSLFSRIFVICACIFGFALMQGVYQGFQKGQERARNSPPGSSAGEAAFRAANSQITSRGSDGRSAWGNSDEAHQLAAAFSTHIRALREV